MNREKEESREEKHVWRKKLRVTSYGANKFTTRGIARAECNNKRDAKRELRPTGDLARKKERKERRQRNGAEFCFAKREMIVFFFFPFSAIIQDTFIDSGSPARVHVAFVDVARACNRNLSLSLSFSHKTIDHDY